MTGSEHIAGRWVVQAELGRGSMGRVLLLAEGRPGSAAQGVPIAGKFLERPELEDDFINEFKLLRRLAHPGFVAPLRLMALPRIPTGADDDRPRLVALMERASGATLTPGLPDLAGDVARIARGLLRALDHLHRLGLVHGDLAPDNVLWNHARGRLTVLDLGAGGERGARSGKTSGVLAYAAPERLEGAGLEPAGDLWSVGALLFGIAHGRHPWPSYPAKRSATPSRRGLEAHPLDPMMQRLLSVDPAARHPSASAALAELESLLPEVRDEPERWVPPALIDPGHRMSDAAEALIGSARARRAASIDIRGGRGSGRSRALGEILERLAMAGVAGVEIPIREDDERAFVADALAALGRPDEEPRLAALLRAIAATGAPVAIGVDDLERAPAVRRLLERVVRSLDTIPEHYHGLQLVTVGLGAGPSLEMPRWSADDAVEAIGLRFPDRRVARRDAEALISAARGNAGLLWALVDGGLQSGVVRVDASQVVCDVTRLATMSPPSLEARAEEVLAELPPRARRVAAIIAWAGRPLALPPDTDLGDEVLPVALIRSLIDMEIAVLEPRGVRLASQALVVAGRRLIPEEEARRTLAGTYQAAGVKPLAWVHRLALGEANVDEGAALLTSSLPAAEGLALVEALRSQGGWPSDPEVALTAGALVEEWGRPEVARDLFLAAKSLAAERGAATSRTQALLGVGRIESAQGRYAKALDAYRQALAGLGDEHGELAVELHAAEARAAVLSGDLESAERAAGAGLERARDQAEIAGLLYTLGLCDWYRGRLDQAETRLDKALNAMREAGDAARARRSAKKEEAAIVTARGLVAHRRGDLVRAARAYAEAMRLGEAADDESRVLTALQNLGVVQHQRGEWTEALDTYREALARAEQLDARAKIAQIAGNLGNLWRYLGEAERAEAVLRRGRAIANEDENRHLAAVIGNLQGDVASDQGELKRAEICYREAIDVALQAQCMPEALEASLNLGTLLVERYELASAREVAERVLAQAEEADNQATQVSAKALMAKLARVGQAGPDRQQGALEEAQRLIDEAVAGVEAHKNPDGRWPVFLEAAMVARDREDVASAEAFSHEVRKVLQAQLDSVPGPYRDAFKTRRDRREAYRETAAFVARPRERNEGKGLGWGRLLEVHKRLAGEHNVQRLLEYIMDSAILLTGAERGFLLLDDESHKEGLRVRVARNLDQENIRNKHLKISRGIARRVIQSGEPVVTVDAMEDDRYKEQLSVVDLRLRSILCVPMTFRGRVLGAIYLDNRFRASAFAGEDERFMEAFCDMAAVALDNARLVESLEAQKRKTEAARREVESLNKRLEAELERRTRELEDTKVQMIAERRQLASEHRFENIIGSAPTMRRLFQMIDRLRNADIAVLIEGESGTGKELVAKAIHFSGQRRERPFIAVNCGAIPATLLESELFGHVRGAFTNATTDKKGLFEVAHTGTLFLDEIGEMPLEMQVKLLRVLQSGEIQKVGATRQLTVDVRIVAATNRKLDEEVKAGRFREDLFYRLSVVPLVVPPLRDRREDIPLLVQHFVELNKKAGLGEVQSISKEALAMLGRYGWPGNVRQLETVLKNASVFADGPVLKVRDFESFPDIVGGGSGGAGMGGKGHAVLSGKTLAELERLAIVQALKDNKGNKKRTAELLGIDRRTLYNKLAAYKITVEADLKVS